jgi:hypothetical protein
MSDNTKHVEALKGALDEFYAATPADHGVDPESFGASELLERLKTERRGLPTRDLRKILSHHHFEIDSVRHFLPRAMELIAFGDGEDHLEAMVVSSRIRPRFIEIPQAEQTALRNVLLQLWNYRVTSGEGDLTELLDFMGWLIDDITPYLGVFKPDAEGLVCRSVARVLQWQANELAHPHEAPCHLKSAEQEKLAAWLDKVGVDNVREAFFCSDDEECADIMAEAVSSWSHARGR